MNEIPTPNLPDYSKVRARLRVASLSFHVRRTVQMNTMFAESVIICPADDPQVSVAALNGLLYGIAVVDHWTWLDPESPDGDCIECKLVAHASE
jgi:hypothetical protein